MRLDPFSSFSVFPSSLRRTILRALVLFSGGAGCNAILDNEPGELAPSTPGQTVNPTEPSTGATTPPSSEAQGEDGGATPPPASEGADGPSCAPGKKVCHGLCVGLDDPL